jgi:hypothetical protein
VGGNDWGLVIMPWIRPEDETMKAIRNYIYIVFCFLIKLSLLVIEKLKKRNVFQAWIRVDAG